MNKKQKEILKEFYRRRAELTDEVIWIGCNPDNPELYKSQVHDGYALMRKLAELSKEFTTEMRRAAD